MLSSHLMSPGVMKLGSVMDHRVTHYAAQEMRQVHSPVGRPGDMLDMDEAVLDHMDLHQQQRMAHRKDLVPKAHYTVIVAVQL